MPTNHDETLLQRYQRESLIDEKIARRIRADEVHCCIADAHDAVMSGAITLDARTQERMLEMLTHSAMEMLKEQRNCGGNPNMTDHLVGLYENAGIALPDAISEFRDDIDAFIRRQALLRTAYRMGTLRYPNTYELVQDD